MYPPPGQFMAAITRSLELSREVVPGAAEHLLAALPRKATLPERVEALFNLLDGSPAGVGPDGEPIPARPPSPYRAPNRRQDMAQVERVLFLLGITKDESQVALTRRFAGLTPLPAGAIARRIVEALYDDEDRTLRHHLLEPPPLPPYEERARTVLETLAPLLAPHVDREDLSRKWSSDLGPLSAVEAGRFVLQRLRQPQYQELLRYGAPERDRVAEDELLAPLIADHEARQGAAAGDMNRLLGEY